MDLDGVLVIAQSEKQDAAATWKEAFRHHPLTGFVDHGAGGSGEPVVGLPRPGNAGSVMGADHIEAARPALAQLPKKYRRGRGTLIRCDDGARAAEPAGDCPKEWPMGTRLIVRRERPHPGAQLRHTDADGMRLPRFATNVKDVPIAEPELRHRWRARAEDRVRAARSTGLRDLLHDAARNRSGRRSFRSPSSRAVLSGPANVVPTGRPRGSRPGTARRE